MTDAEQEVAIRIANWLQRRATRARQKAGKIVYTSDAARRTADMLRTLADHDEGTSLAILNGEWDQ